MSPKSRRADKSKMPKATSGQTGPLAAGLPEREILYHLLFEHSLDAILLTSPDGSILFANPAACLMFGRTEAELKELGRAGIVDATDPRLKAALEQRDHSGSFRGELSLLRRDGSKFPAEVSTNTFRFANDMTGTSMIIRDITERKQAEEQIRSLARFPSENPNPVLRLGNDGIILYANSASQLLLKDWGCEVGDQAPVLLQGQVREVIASRKNKTIDLQGGAIVYSCVIAYVPNEKHVNIYGRDITERKQAEERFRLVVESAPSAIILSDRHGTIVMVNGHAEKLFGYERAELVGLEIDRLLPKRVRTSHASHRRDFLSDPQTRLMGLGRDLYGVRKDGSEFPVEVGLAPIDASDQFLVMSTIADISRRKQSEQALRESEARFRHAIEVAPFPIQIHAEDGEVITINQAWTDLTGYSLGDIPTITDWTEKAYAGMASFIREEIQRLYDSTNRIDEGEEEIRTASGERRTWKFNSAPLGHMPDGRKLVMSMAVDLTERKQAEAALANSEKRFRSLIEHAPDGIALLDLDGKLQQVTPTVTQILGYTPEESVGQDPASMTHPDDLPDLLALLGDLIQNPGKVAKATYRFKHKNGSWRWLESTISNLISEPAVNAIVFNYRDITARQQSEEAMRASEAQFRSLFEDSPVALWVEDFSEVKQLLDQLRQKGIVDLPAYIHTRTDFIEQCMASVKILDVNSATLKLYHAKDKNQLLGSLKEQLPLLPPEQFESELIQLAQGRLNFEREGSDQTFTGEQIFVNMRWSVAPGYEDTLAKIIISTMDVTERRRTEQQIQQQLKRLNSLRLIDAAITSSFDLQVALDILLQEAHSQLGVDACAILPFNASLQTFHYLGSLGFRSEALHHMYLKPGEGRASLVMRERKILHLPDLTKAAGKTAGQPAFPGESFTDYYGVPLIAKGQVKGVLEIYHRSPLKPGPDWLEFLETLAGQAALAIDNAQLFENLQRSNAELERRVAERTAELNRTNAELEHANQAKDEFLANMSHELRTPLNSILGLSEALLEQRRGTLNDSQQRSLQTIESSGQHLLELINDILDLSKVEAGMFDIYPQPVALDELCRSCLAFVKSQAARKSIALIENLDPSLSQMIADPRRMKQVLVNLLTNAVKFTPEQGQVTLEVRADPTRERIRFSVIDTGIGIAPADLERVFRPFVQVESGLTRQFEGTGLGLALVQKLVDLQGGSVSVESAVGQGSRFTVNLPLLEEAATRPAIPALTSTPATREAAQQPAVQPGTPNARGLVLLAEDNTANILTMGEYLESHGYQVVTAHDGWEALSKAAEADPNIILMDIQMPAMDGLEATRRLRANPRFAATPIIALTALAMPGDRERCLEAGATEYMSKPVSLKMLAATIARLLEAQGK